jgi:tyrosine-protein kinase Etk/Wzc
MDVSDAVPEINANGQDMAFGEALLTLRRHWRRIALSMAVTIGLALAYVLFTAPQFMIGGSLYLGDARSTAPAGAASSGLSFLSDFQAISDINTQVDLIKSKALVERAILESGLNAPVRPAGQLRMSYWAWSLLHGQAVDAYAPKPGDLVAADAVLAAASATPQKLEIEIGDGGTYRITQPGGWFGEPVTVLDGVLGQPASGGGLSLILKPAVNGAPPAQGTRFSLKVTTAAAVAERLQKTGAFTVLAGGTVANPTKIANLQYFSPNPYTGAAFINQLMTDFTASQLSWNNQAASATQSFIAQQLAGIRASLSEADQKLSAYQSSTGIIDVPENAKAMINELAQYEMQRTTLQLQQEALRRLNAEIAHPTGTLNPYLLSQTGDSVLGQLATSLAAEQTKLDTLQSQFTADAPDVQAEQAAVARIKSSIRSVAGNELDTTSDSLNQLNDLISAFNAKLRAMPAESLQVIALTRASDVYGQIYVLLMQKEEEAEVSKAAAIGDTRIVTPAEIPLRAAAPKVFITMGAAMMMGLFIGIALVLGQRSLSSRFQSEDDIRRLVHLPVYGLIPRQTEITARTAILPPHPQNPFTEPVRMLQGNIIRSAAPQASRVILLTSAGVDDGKTTIAVNLAKILADSGKRVVLVDGDLHRGRLHQSLRSSLEAGGLTEWLVTMNRPQMTFAPGQRFTLLTTGILPPNPSELIHEPYMANIITSLRAEFDYVVIDSPPLPAVADGMALGELADLILSVVMVGHTSRHAFALHNELLGRLGRRHGIIINGTANDAYAYGYGYGYGMAQDVSMAGRLLRLLERA